MKNLDYREISNARISSRMKQVLVLIAVILIGMLISASVNAIPSSKSMTAKVAQQTSTPQVAKR
jgi:hypothetical protein